MKNYFRYYRVLKNLYQKLFESIIHIWSTKIHGIICKLQVLL